MLPLGLLAAALLPALGTPALPADTTPSPRDTAPAAQPASPAPAPAPTTAAPTLPAVTFFGEVRTRSELDHPVGAPRADAFTYLRSRLGARATVSEGVRLVLAVQDSRVLGTETQAGAASTLDMHEGYLEIARPAHGAQLALRAGRQEIVVGNERLLGRVNWSNAGQSFDGLRLTAGPRASTRATTRAAARAPWSATAFATTLVERGPRFGGTTAGAPAEPDHHVFGLAATRPLAWLDGGAGELTVLHDRGVHARGREVTARTTLAARLRAARVLGLSADLEGALQAGAEHALATAASPAGRPEDIRAWMLGARVGTPASTGATATPRRLGAVVGLDLLSGGAPSSDARDGAFSTLYATNHQYYGLGDVVAGDPAASLKGRGLADAFAGVTFAATPALALRADLHRMAPARTHGLPNGLLGWEADVVAPYRVAPGASIEVGYAVFRAGDAGAALGLGQAGRVRGWGYLQLTAGF